MLVLTRKINEALCIGDDVRVRVLEYNGKQVKLGIEAPRRVRVVREEIYLKIAEANRSAAEDAAQEEDA
ncbi:MAG: carbon storage regulator CsrA [Myxococcales bacterium]|nr:carbon storage regulator CsrA [Myxococcales bacterium]